MITFSTDSQAMARIWRRGQNKTVHIYRFLSTGTIDEKIYQRQVKKLEMNTSVFNDKKSNTHGLSNEDLKDIFIIDDNTDCLTHSQSQCKCLNGDMNSSDWTHIPLNSEYDTFNLWSNVDADLNPSIYCSMRSLASFAFVRSG